MGKFPSFLELDYNKMDGDKVKNAPFPMEI